MHNWAVLAGAISQLMSLFLIEPRYEKAGFLHMRKQRRRSASLTAKLIGVFVFTIRIVQFLFYL